MPGADIHHIMENVTGIYASVFESGVYIARGEPMNSGPRGQSRKSQLLRSVAGPRAYAMAKGVKLVRPLRRRSYGQNGEDVILRDLLPSRAHGVYLDIGSSHPIHLSNTYGFYRMGWRGVCVDPLSVNNKLARVFRPKDTNVLGLVSSERNEVRFFEFDPSFYSTSDPDVASRWVAEGAHQVSAKNIMAIPARDLPFQTSPTRPSFLSLDVEGHELPVLQSLDWESQRPWLILVELWNNEERDDVNKSVRGLLASLGYQQLVQASPDNFIFGHQDARGYLRF